eukprot:4369582-Amphidinium_carterae.1
MATPASVQKPKHWQISQLPCMGSQNGYGWHHAGDINYGHGSHQTHPFFFVQVCVCYAMALQAVCVTCFLQLSPESALRNQNLIKKQLVKSCQSFAMP